MKFKHSMLVVDNCVVERILFPGERVSIDTLIDIILLAIFYLKHSEKLHVRHKFTDVHFVCSSLFVNGKYRCFSAVESDRFVFGFRRL